MEYAFILVGAVLRLYAQVINIEDSTIKAMGSLALKKTAGLVGTLLVLAGAIMLLAKCS